MQLIGTTIVGALFFGCWQMAEAKMIGIIAIILIIIGVCMTAFHEKTNHISPHNFRVGVLLSVFGSFGFIACNSLPKIPSASGWEMLLPLSLGMLFSAGAISLSTSSIRQQHPFWNVTVFRNLLTGIMFGLAQCGYFFSMEANGLSTGFVLSQMCVIISTFGGIVFLHEHKTHHELLLTILGLFLVLSGGIMISFIC